MELREYWRIVRRYLWLIGLVVAITLVTTVTMRYLRPRPTVYSVRLRVTAGVTPEERSGDYYTYDRYYTWLASEYLVDDLSEVVRSAAFAEAVSQELRSQGLSVAPGTISGSTVPEKQHRILTITINGYDPERLLSIGEATAKVLRERNKEFLVQLSSQNASVHLIDPPSLSVVPPSLRERMDLPLRLFLALIAGLGLAFFFDYIDDSVRDRRDLQELGLPLIAVLPKQKKG